MYWVLFWQIALLVNWTYFEATGILIFLSVDGWALKAVWLEVNLSDSESIWSTVIELSFLLSFVFSSRGDNLLLYVLWLTFSDYFTEVRPFSFSITSLFVICFIREGLSPSSSSVIISKSTNFLTTLLICVGVIDGWTSLSGFWPTCWSWSNYSNILRDCTVLTLFSAVVYP